MANDIVETEDPTLVDQRDLSPSAFLSLAIFPAARAVADAFASQVPMDPAVVRDSVEALLAEMRVHGLKAELPLTHFHGGGLYARELVLPKGTFAIGEIQKYPHISIISKGEISMLNEDGGVTVVKAPCTIVSKPGVRKCGFAHEDTVWTTVHNMSDCDIEDPASAPVEMLEKFLTVSTQEEHAMFLESQKMIEVSTCQ